MNDNIKTGKEIRAEIFDKVKQLYSLKAAQENFIPGETLINYAGRVYNEKEIINLVDASLDFWLTAGRFAEQFEKQFAEFLGAKYCLLTNSGSSANLLAISALTSPKLGVRQLKKGDEVGLMLAAANRDPNQFENASSFDPSRKNKLNVTFGAGIHFCIGAPLARLEMQVGLKILFQRLPCLKLAEQPEYSNAYHFHGLEKLMVSW